MKLRVNGLDPVQYYWDFPSGESILLNDYVAKPIRICHTGKIACIACGRLIKKTFQQGYCFPCTQRLAACDLCVLRPHTCHYHLGTCREPDWGLKHCMIEHIVYLANTSQLKVGLTRAHLRHQRWADQGATQALAILGAKTRYQAGLAEAALAQEMADKTNWRALLQGNNQPLPLQSIWDNVRKKMKSFEGVKVLEGEFVTHLSYPVLEFPKKIVSFSFDKEQTLEGILIGIKGQYLLFEDNRVVNLRKFSGYELKWEE